MKYRKLRIAWSVFCGVLCVLVVVLWVRSYSHTDSLTQVNANQVLTRLGTNFGILFFGWTDYKTTPNLSPPDATDGWEYQEYDGRPMVDAVPCWRCTWGTTESLVSLPAWFVTFFTFLLAAAPWICWSKRFSLRTLLIMMTAVSVGLALIVGLSRR